MGVHRCLVLKIFKHLANVLEGLKEKRNKEEKRRGSWNITERNGGFA